MALKIHKLVLGLFQTNCYVLGDERTREAIVIDPPDSAPEILNVLKRESWSLREILVTHAHFDHVLALDELKAATGTPFRLHKADLPQLDMLPQVAEMLIGRKVSLPPVPDGFVDEGDTITVGSIRLDVLFTPGHTPGHVSYVSREHAVVFSGDCLFPGSIGRTDLPGGDYPTLMRSICDRLLPLGDEYVVAGGHMPTTTIGRERTSNPFLLDWMDAPG
jgi:hydroxyacylglutathione hydrolase